MQHYKNTAGAVYWIDSDADRHFLPPDCVPITDAEADALRAPTPSQLSAAAIEQAKEDLMVIDLASIRALREYVASRADAPQIIKDREAAAVAARARLVP